MSLPLSLESRIVFLTAAGEHGDAELHELLRDATNWEQVLAMALVHKASASLCRAIERNRLHCVPETVMQQLRQQKMVADFHSLHLHKKLVESLRVLQQREVPVLLLKGAALGASVYPSFLERPMADIDLLVHPADVTRARAALCDAGWKAEDHPARESFYAEHHHVAPLKDVQGTGHAIELHIRAFPPPNPFGDVAAEMWRSAGPTTSEFSGALVPTPTHMLVYACVHFVWSHKMHKGAWRTIRDISELSRATIDWTDVVATAQRWKAGSCSYWALRLAGTLSGVAVPRNVLGNLSPPMGRVLGNVLERHVVACAIPGERPICPSQRVGAMMWRLVVRPRWSGHVTRTPADHAELWVDSRPDLSAMDSTIRGNHGLRLGAWWQYVSSVVAGVPPQATKFISGGSH